MQYVRPCSYCGGYGLKTFVKENSNGEIIDQYTDYCPHCGGTGEEWDIFEEVDISEDIEDTDLYLNDEDFKI